MLLWRGRDDDSTCYVVLMALVVIEMPVIIVVLVGVLVVVVVKVMMAGTSGAGSNWGDEGCKLKIVVNALIVMISANSERQGRGVTTLITKERRLTQ